MTRITCISASNIEPSREHSASTRACEMVKEILQTECDPTAQVEIIPLIDYELKPCRMCGKCIPSGKCVRDEAFNQIHNEMIHTDALFLVCPHYAPFPSKLMMLLEKMQEMWYLNWCNDDSYRAPYYKHPIGLIAHGGQTSEALPYYKRTLLDPLSIAFSGVQLHVVGIDQEWPNGAVFGIKQLSATPGSIFVTIDHDWEDIRNRITPLVKNVFTQIIQ